MEGVVSVCVSVSKWAHQNVNIVGLKLGHSASLASLQIIRVADMKMCRTIPLPTILSMPLGPRLVLIASATAAKENLETGSRESCTFRLAQNGYERRAQLMLGRHSKEIFFPL